MVKINGHRRGRKWHPNNMEKPMETIKNKKRGWERASKKRLRCLKPLHSDLQMLLATTFNSCVRVDCIFLLLKVTISGTE